MARPTLWVTMGVPGSGKTTWANKHDHAIIVSREDIAERMGLPCGSDTVRYECRAQVRDALMRGSNCVYDWVNVYREQRRPYIELVREHAARGVLAIFEVEPLVAWQRILAAGRGTPRLEALIATQHKALEQALEDIAREGWDEIYLAP